MDVRTVVVGVDGSGSSDHAVEWAAREASRRGLPLELLHTSSSASMVGAPPGGAVPLGGSEPPVLDAAAERALRVEPGIIVRRRQESGDAAAALVHAGEEAALVVVGSHGRSWAARVLLGSVSHRVTAHARTPVVVVHDRLRDESLPVAVGVDGSSTSDVAVQVAADEARIRGVPLVVVHGWLAAPVTSFDVMPVTQEVVDSQEEVARQLVGGGVTLARATAPGLVVRSLIASGPPLTALRQAAETCQLLVVGAHGHRGATGAMFGSVASAAVDIETCPVMVTPAAR